MKIFQIGKPRPRRNNGFTLFELLIVIMVLALFTSLAMIRIDGAVSGGDIRQASRVLIGEIGYLRGQAAYTHQECRLTLDVDQNLAYTMEPLITQEEASEKEKKEEIGPARKDIKIPEGVTIEDVVIFPIGKIQDGEAPIHFYANGCVDRSLIHLRNENDMAYTLEINPLTGNVIVHDKYIDQQIN